MGGLFAAVWSPCWSNATRRTQVIVVDNGSTDGTADILDGFTDRVTVVFNETNAGFAVAQNQAIAMTRTDWVLALNPDVLLMPGFIATLVAAGESDPKVGTVCGKLLSMSADFQLPPKPSFDSTGVYFTPTLRHFDRGSGETDNGQYERCEYVFGATGAAALYRRKMIEHISIGGEFYDHDFFVYREDADVAWRAQLFGWTCLYVPFAQGYHVRTVKPSQPQESSSVHQHALGEEPIPAAHQECHRGPLSSPFIYDFVPGSRCYSRLPHS